MSGEGAQRAEAIDARGVHEDRPAAGGDAGPGRDPAGTPRDRRHARGRAWARITPTGPSVPAPAASRRCQDEVREPSHPADETGVTGPSPLDSPSSDATPQGDSGPDRSGPRSRPAGEAVQAADAVVQLLGEATLRRLDVAANTGIPPEKTRRFWHALGFAAAPSEEDTLYTRADQEAIQRTVAILASGTIDEPLALALTRAIARSLDRLAAWQSSLIMESVLRAQNEDSLHADPLVAPGVGDLPTDLAAALALEREADEQLWHRRLSPAASREAGQVLLELVDEIEPLIIYAWRRHLAATIGRLMTAENDDEDAGVRQAVGFADMVGFTTLVRRLSERQLARLVQHFEELAADIVAARGGRIVKMLGDEVVFAADTPQAAADIALDLLDIVADDPSMPQLRVGIALGPVLSHLGDVFGTTVNRASRLTNVARPHTVVVDDAMATYLADDPGFLTNRLPPRALRGLGMTVVWHLGRASRAPQDKADASA